MLSYLMLSHRNSSYVIISKVIPKQKRSIAGGGAPTASGCSTRTWAQTSMLLRPPTVEASATPLPENGRFGYTRYLFTTSNTP